MKTVLNAQINGTAPFFILAGLTPALGPVAIATGLATTVGFTGGVYGTLNNGGRGLRYNNRRRFSRLLGQSVRNNRYGHGRNLHGQPLVFASRLFGLSLIYGEKLINHSVINWELNKCFKWLGKCSLLTLRKQGGQ